MARYLDIDGLKLLMIVPPHHVDEVEEISPGWTLRQIDHWCRWVDSRLHKLYKVPFAAHDEAEPTPPTIQTWVAQLVTLPLMMRRGVDPNDLQFDLVKEMHETARGEVLEAATGDQNHFDIPLLAGENGGGPSRGGPLSYSEQSPYVGHSRQSRRGRFEDESGSGTGG